MIHLTDPEELFLQSILETYLSVFPEHVTTIEAQSILRKIKEELKLYLLEPDKNLASTNDPFSLIKPYFESRVFVFAKSAQHARQIVDAMSEHLFEKMLTDEMKHPFLSKLYSTCELVMPEEPGLLGTYDK